MGWVIYAVMALFVLALSAFLAIALSLKRTGRLVKPFWIIFAGTFISTFILLFAGLSRDMRRNGRTRRESNTFFISGCVSGVHG